MLDLIIPLGTGSKSNNDELKLFLRSVEKNAANVRNVLVVTDCVPDWLTGVTVIPCGDPLSHNKDGNIIQKVLTALEHDGISTEFVWSSDDCAVLKPLDFATLPPLYNIRNKECFPADGSIWQRRVRRTFEYLETRSVHLEHNFESHTPQRFPTARLRNVMQGVDFASGIGYSIDTLWFGLLGVTGGVEQRQWKETCEKASGWKLDKPLVGYNDKAFLNGLREALFRRFPAKSKYER